MTHIYEESAKQAGKWRKQADQIAMNLKNMQNAFQKETITFGVVFDDAIVRITVRVQTIREMDERKLADHVHELVLSAVRTQH